MLVPHTIGIIHQIFGEIQSTTRELYFLPISSMLACCRLMLLLLPLAKFGRSTLDTNEGYNTKTKPTNSVTLIQTLILIKTNYWD